MTLLSLVQLTGLPTFRTCAVVSSSLVLRSPWEACYVSNLETECLFHRCWSHDSQLGDGAESRGKTLQPNRMDQGAIKGDRDGKRSGYDHLSRRSGGQGGKRPRRCQRADPP